MFKTETHLHTKEVSKCATVSAAELMHAYKNAGYHTVFVTDHFQANTIGSYGDVAWEEKIRKFLDGYNAAKAEGEKLGLTVLMSAEFCFPGSPNHYLAYGITEEFLLSSPDMNLFDIERFSRTAKEAGVLLVQAHPYRDGKNTPTPEYVDAIEVYNSHPRHEDHSELSEALAKEYGLPISAGSDTHQPEDIARSGILTDEPIESSADLIRHILNRDIKIIKETI